MFYYEPDFGVLLLKYFLLIITITKNKRCTAFLLWGLSFIVCAAVVKKKYVIKIFNP